MYTDSNVRQLTRQLIAIDSSTTDKHSILVDVAHERLRCRFQGQL